MTTLHPRHIRPLLLEALTDTRVVFIHPREQTIPLGDRLWALPIAALWV